MLVTYDNHDDIVDLLCNQQVLALDTETSGLRAHGGDSLFAIIFATVDQEFYFNYNIGGLHHETMQSLQQIFNSPSRLIYLHNARFDLAFLAKESLELKCKIHDTMSLMRLINNDLPSYSLDNLSKLCLKKDKDDKVKEYILKNKLWKWERIPGKLVRNKKLHFDKVPLEIIQPYAELDARLTYDLGQYQYKEICRLHKYADLNKEPSFGKLYTNERDLTKTVFRMEQRGVKIDLEYCKEARKHENMRLKEGKQKFYDLTSQEYQDSGKLFEKVIPKEFQTMGKPSEKTSKISPTFAYDAIAHLYGSNDIITTILDCRDAKSRSNYYEGFLYYADQDGILHASFNQGGTATGRFSSSNPNLQNLTKEEGQDLAHPYIIRRAIVPRPGYFFLMIDFQAMEYRLMLDLAGAEGLIEKVKGGLDVHQATADMAGITRKQAKTVNFGILYGIGLEKLGKQLGVSKDRAAKLRSDVFSASPEIRDFIFSTTARAKESAWSINWMGRRCNFEDKNFCYRAPNYEIQGGCADIIKIAMNKIDEFLVDKRSKMVLTIHDEIVVEVHADEKEIIEPIISIMENTYPHKLLPMKCEASASWKSLADKRPLPDFLSSHELVKHRDVVSDSSLRTISLL